MFLWPNLFDRETATQLSTDEDELTSLLPGNYRAQDFPEQPPRQAIIVGVGGVGKTSLLHAIVHRLAATQWTPAFIRLPELAQADKTVLEFLDGTINRRFDSAVPWSSLCTSGQAAILFDGLDEVSIAKRPALWERIREFMTKYPTVSWLLTTRDAAVLPSSVPGVPLLALTPLDPRQVHLFCEAYLGGPDSPLVQRLNLKLMRNAELRRMTRIPLFLAILLDDRLNQQDAATPTNRGELLERYLTRTFAPQHFKPAIRIGSSPHVLRGVSEALAALTLEGNAFDFDERTARNNVIAMGHADPENVFQDLVATGLLRRNGSRLHFAFPIVQEYLAGCFIADHHSSTIPTRLEAGLTRAWAQALQFAIERLPDADAIIAETLRQTDDMFRSRLHLAARCIANGARISAATRQQVADGLALFWSEHSASLASRSADLLAEAFARPLPAAARQRLREGHGFGGDGGGLLLSAEQDDDLTLAALAAVIKTDRHLPLFHEWADALARVAPQFYAALTGYAHAQSRPLPTASLVYVIDKIAHAVDARPLPESQLASIIEDEVLPAAFRLCVAVNYGRPDAQVLSLLETAIHQSPQLFGRVDGYAVVEQVLWGRSDAIDLWRKFMRDASIAEIPRKDLIFSITQREDTEKVLALLRATDLSSLDRVARLALLASAAYLRDAGAFDEYTKAFEPIDPDEAIVWLMLASRHAVSPLVENGLRRIIARRRFLLRHLGLIGPMLGHSMSFELQTSHLSGAPQLGPAIQNPARPLAASLVWEWAGEQRAEPHLIQLLSTALELRHPNALSELRNVVERTIASAATLPIEQSNDVGHPLADAIQKLEQTASRLSEAALSTCAIQPHSNVSSTAIRLLSQRGTPDALKRLVEIYMRSRDASSPGARWARDDLLAQIERAALRLGRHLTVAADGSVIVQ